MQVPATTIAHILKDVEQIFHVVRVEDLSADSYDPLVLALSDIILFLERRKKGKSKEAARKLRYYLAQVQGTQGREEIKSAVCRQVTLAIHTIERSTVEPDL